jgi:acid phosphatase (class A)
MKTRYSVFALTFIALASIAALAAGETKPPQFIRPDSIDVVALLPDPPRAGSSEAQHELQEVLEVQASRSAEESKRAKDEATFTPFAFANVLGDWFTAENCPNTAKLFDVIETDSRYFSKLGKEHWNRPRPPAADAHVMPLIDEKDFGYPSGHATRGIVYATVLAEIFPEQREKLMERGAEIGWDRVIAGVHYPSDVTAGRTLGKAIPRQLLANPQFVEQLNAIKPELALAGHQATIPVGK